MRKQLGTHPKLFAGLALTLLSLPGAGWAQPTVSVTPSAGSGSSQTFSVSASQGGYVISEVYINFSDSSMSTLDCMAALVPSTNLLYLWNTPNAPNNWYQLPAGTSVSNSNCTLNAGASGHSGSGSSVTANFAISFSPGYVGTKTTWVAATSNAPSPNNTSGFVAKGTWSPATVPAPTVSLAPASGTGARGTFSVTATQQGGYNIQEVYLNFSDSGMSSLDCLVALIPSANALYLWNSSNNPNGWYQLPAGGSAHNGDCTLNGGASGYSGGGSTVIANFALMFQNPSYAGTRVTWFAAVNDQGVTSNWQDTDSGTETTWEVDPTVTLVNTGNWHTGLTNFYVGDTFTLTVSGEPSQSVTLNYTQNGAGGSLSEGFTDSNGNLVILGTETPGEVGTWTEQWVVGGVPAIPTLAFSVVPLGCTGTVVTSSRPGSGANDPPVAAGTLPDLNVTMPGATSTTLQVNGASTNPYSTSVSGITATPSATPTFTFQFSTTGFPLGGYIVVPTATNNGYSSTCTNTVGFFNVAATTPNPPPQANCASMTGSWAESTPGFGSWILTDLSGAISGYVAGSYTNGSCTFSPAWTISSSSYNSQNQSYTLFANNPQPPTGCGILAATYLSVTGSLSPAPQCGMGAERLAVRPCPSLELPIP